MRTRPLAILLGLIMLGSLAQITPFLLHPVPEASSWPGAKVPSQFPDGYAPADDAKACALGDALFWGGIASTVTGILLLWWWLRSGIAERAGAIEAPKIRAWLSRLLFLVALFLSLRLINLPQLYFRFEHLRAFGLSALPTGEWIGIVLLALPVPFALFVLKFLFVICTLPIFGRWWWLASALGIFLIGGVVPEVLSRTQPMDPVEKLRTLDSGAHHEAMKAVMRKAGLDLPIVVADESRRSRRASLSLTGRAGREYILATDTFIEKYTPHEMSLALAHELGHLDRRTPTLVIHLGFGLVVQLLGFGLVYLWSGRAAPPVSHAPRIVLLCLLCLTLAVQAVTPFELAFLRREEKRADDFALQLTGEHEAFGRLLVTVARHELEPLDLPWWQYHLSADHPTIRDRLVNAQR